MPARPLVLLWVRSVKHFIEIQAPAFEGYDFPPNTAPEFCLPETSTHQNSMPPAAFRNFAFLYLIFDLMSWLLPQQATLALLASVSNANPIKKSKPDH